MASSTEGTSPRGVLEVEDAQVFLKERERERFSKAGNLTTDRYSELNLRDRRVMDMHAEPSPELTPCIPPLTLVLADLTFIKDCRLAWKIRRMDEGKEPEEESKQTEEDEEVPLSGLARDARTQQFLENYVIPLHGFAQTALRVTNFLAFLFARFPRTRV